MGNFSAGFNYKSKHSFMRLMAYATSLALLLSLFSTLQTFSPSKAFATSPSRQLTYVHDPEGKLTAAIDPASAASVYHYNPLGAVSSITQQPVSSLSVLGFAPFSIKAGGQLTVYGTGFSTTLTSNIVKIGAVSAMVVSASATKLVVTIPAGAATGLLSVTVGTASASSANNLEVRSTVSIISVVPKIVQPGDTVTITGTGFSTISKENSLFLGSLRAPVVSATSTQLTAVVPPLDTTGKVWVNTPFGSAQATDSLYITPDENIPASRISNTALVDYNQAVPVNFTSTANVALVSFTAKRGDHFSVNVARGSFGGLGNVAIYAPDGRKFADAIIPYTALDDLSPIESGVYTVFYCPEPGLSSTDRCAYAAGSSTITVSKDTEVSASFPSPLPYSISANIPGQDTRFNFTLNAPKILNFAVTDSTIRANSQGTGEIRVLDPFGKIIGSSCSFSSGKGACREMHLATGDYTVVVSTGGGQGSASFYGVEDAVYTASALSSTSFSVSTSKPGQNYQYVFPGVANHRINIFIPSFSGLGTTSLLAPDGSQIASTFGYSPGSLQSILLPASGQYTAVFVRDDVSAVGALSAYISESPIASGVEGAAGQILSLSVTGQSGYYTFSAVAGSELNISATSIPAPWNGLNITLFHPNGASSMLPSSQDGSTRSYYSLPETGVYSIIVSPSTPIAVSGTVGSPKVFFTQSVSSPINPVSTVVSAAISTPGKLAAFSFTMPSGGSVHPYYSKSTFASGVRFYVADSSGNSLAASGSLTGASNSWSFQLSQAGTYTIFVDGANGTDLGSLSLQLTVLLNMPTGSSRVPPSAPAPLLLKEVPVAPVSAIGFPEIKHVSKLSFQSLSLFKAGVGQTAVSGVVADSKGTPLKNIKISTSFASTVSDANGRFIILVPRSFLPAKLSVFPVLLTVDGTFKNKKSVSYGQYSFSADVTKNQTTSVGFPIFLTPLSTKLFDITSNSHSQSVSSPDIAGLKLLVPAGEVITDAAGKRVKKISITAINTATPPFPLPLGTRVPVYFTVQPAGAFLSKPVQLVYPNYTNLPAFSKVQFWNYTPQASWFVYGAGSVSKDSKSVVPFSSVKLWNFSGAMISGDIIPPAVKSLEKNVFGGDPVDTNTGLFDYSKTDLKLAGPMPFNLTRTYRQLDNNEYSFGRGQSSFLDFDIFSQSNYQSFDFVVSGGETIHFVRTSPGNGIEDAAYVAAGTSGKFQGATMVYGSSSLPGIWSLQTRDGTTYQSGDVAPLQAIVDRFGNYVSLNHTSMYDRIPNDVVLSSGHWLHVDQNAGNLVSKVTTDANQSTSYLYDSSGRLISAFDAAGGETKYAYDTSQDDPSGGVSSSPTSDNMLSVTDPDGVVYLQNQYDTNNRVIKQTFADGSFTSFAYTTDPSNSVLSEITTSPEGKKQQTMFSSFGFPYQETAAFNTSLAATTSYLYDSSHRLSQKTDPDGVITTYAYDQAGNLASTVLDSGSPFSETTSCTYNKFNEISTCTDPLGRTENYLYNSVGALISSSDAAGNITQVSYNGFGGVASVIAPGETTPTVYGYDPGGSLISKTTPGGKTVSYLLDLSGNMLFSRDANGSVSSYTYDALGEVLSTTGPLGDVNSFTYDKRGNKLSWKDASNNTTYYAYDNTDQLVSTKDRLNRTTSYVYFDDGLLSSVTEPDGQMDSFSYDALSRQITANYGAETVASSYNSMGLPLSSTDTLGMTSSTVSNTYDELGRLSSTTSPVGVTSYAYDKDNRTVLMTVSGQPVVSYAYDTAGRVSSLTRGSQVASFTYDATSRLKTSTNPSGVSSSYSYDADSSVLGVSYSKGSTTLGALAYAYDPAGLKNSVSGTIGVPTLDTPLSAVSYDAEGEVLSRAGASYSYDADGQLLSNGTSSYSWTPRGLLASATTPSGVSSFVYDPASRLQSTTFNNNTSSLLYDGSSVVLEKTNNVVSATRLSAGQDQTISRTDTASNTTVSYLTDPLLNVVGTVSAAGSLLSSPTFSVYGAPSGAGAGPVGFSGAETDANSKLVHLAARWYDPSSQSFISPDPASSGSSPYPYADSDPADLNDPSGNDPLGGALVAGFASSNYLAGRKTKGQFAASLVKALILGAVPAPTEEFAFAEEIPAAASDITELGVAAETEGASAASELVGAGDGAAASEEAAVEDTTGGATGECNSFPAGTNVTLPDGSLKDISQVQPGDKVFSSDPSSGVSDTGTVTQVVKKTGKEPETKVQFSDGSSITSTSLHPFWDVTVGKWVAASDLKIGDALRTPNGMVLHVVSVRALTVSNSSTVYNLTVEGLHTFYVTSSVVGGNSNAAGSVDYAHSVLVHNSSCLAGNRARGTAGEARARQDLENQGYDNIRSQVSIKSNGVVARVDFVARKDGKTFLFEVKTGAADFTKNQKSVYTDLANGGSATILSSIPSVFEKVLQGSSVDVSVIRYSRSSFGF